MTRPRGKLIGNCAAAVVIAAWEKHLDVALPKQVFAGSIDVDLTTDAEGFVSAAE
jgi:hypothetical protein